MVGVGRGQSAGDECDAVGAQQIADRREVLSKSGNAEYVMAFNPNYEPFIEDVSPLFEAADGSLDYSDYYQSDSLSHVDNK